MTKNGRMAMEVKRVNIRWYEKIDMSENELVYAEELLEVDKDLTECDNILSEIGLQIGYSRYEKQIYEIAEKRQHLCSYVMALPDYMESHLDEPLRKNLNHGASETISRIHMADFRVENTLGLMVMPVNRECWGLTLLLSLGTGLTVGQVGNHLIFERNGIEIFRKEVIECGSGTQGVGNPVTVEGRGNTGRTIPNTLNEQMAMHQVQSNPLEGATKVPLEMTDPR